MADHQSGHERSGGVQVIARAASILRAIESAPNGLSLGQIAKRTGLARSSVQRIVQALVAEDFVSPSGGREGLRIGPGIARLAGTSLHAPSQTIARLLRDLGADVGETVDLATLSGGSVVFVDQVQGSHRLVALSAVGERFPLHCTANGKAILSLHSKEDAEVLIGKSLDEHPDHKLRNRRALLRELEDARATRLAHDFEEHGQGIFAIGTAFRGPDGSPLAVSIPVPAQRFAEQREYLAERLLAFRARVREALRG
jgi:DNA-binding IclR family transcriptional regulator